MKTRRTHDKIYLKENRYEKTKEAFKFIIDKSFTNADFKSKLNICDIGCAAGEFLFYLDSIAPKSNLYGLDVMDSLLHKAKKYVPNSEFRKGSVLDKSIFEKNTFDKIYMTGVHMIFDEFETSLNNLIRWTKPQGSILIMGLFNPFPIDVFIKYKMSKDYLDEFLESGWNIFSQDSISNFLKSKSNIVNHEFIKFEIDINLKKNIDQVRSWTFKDSKNNRIITNGLCIIQYQYLLKINL